MLKSEDPELNNNEKSFIWIIKALWKIKDDVMKDMFPRYLDTYSIQFLLKVIVVGVCNNY